MKITKDLDENKIYEIISANEMLNKYLKNKIIKRKFMLKIA